ncbi:alpha/beta-hydrolase family protein [Streptomyces sp. NPDC086554]|uniref:alpha/beta-hydrolase family protein n=1 Tax=Streptomyces sp. NPDC086554 TaxID=3154864 RepID=UPI0034262827
MSSTSPTASRTPPTAGRSTALGPLWSPGVPAAKDPVRVYVSASAPESFSDEDPFAAKARLAVEELERTGAFERNVLAIAGTTGTGWVNADITDPLEYMHDDLLARTDGALIVGTPNFAPMSQEIRDGRDTGSPVWRPLYDGGRNVRFAPLVTFWQTSVDMVVSYGVEASHGHRYGAGPVDGWAAIVPREGWTTGDTERLRRYVAGRE